MVPSPDEYRDQLREAADEEPGAHEEHERKGDARDDEASLNAVLAPSAGRARGAFSKQIVQVAPESGGERHQREQRGAAERQHARERNDAPVERDRADTRKARRQHGRNRLKCPVSERQTEQPSATGKDQRFAEQDLEEPEASGSEGGTNADVALPRDRAAEHQVRHVRARDEQHEADRREQDHQRPTHLTRQVLGQHLRADRHLQRVAETARVILPDACGQRRDLGGRL